MDALSRFGDHDLPADRPAQSSYFVEWIIDYAHHAFHHAIRISRLNHVLSYCEGVTECALESLLHFLFIDWQAILIHKLRIHSVSLRVGVSFGGVYRFFFRA